MNQDNYKKSQPDPNELLDRLKTAFNLRFDSDLARFLNINASTVATWRKKSSMKFDRIIEFSNTLNLNWLFYGEGPVWRNEVRGSTSEPELPYYTDLLPDKEGIAGDSREEMVCLPMPERFLREELNCCNEDLFVTRASGNSMEPTIRDRELLLVHRTDRKPYAGRVYLVRMEESILCKRLHEEPEGRVRLISDNKQYKEMTMKQEAPSFEILGRVVWHGRTL
ncbi:MAG: S24 family peptidase [Balneolaceae bacterium]